MIYRCCNCKYRSKGSWCKLTCSRIDSPSDEWCSAWEAKPDKLVEFVADCHEAMPNVALD